MVVGVVLLQLGLVARGYWSDHREFAFQMFPESSSGARTSSASPPRAGASRSRSGGRATTGTGWCATAGSAIPSLRHHADAGLQNQLAFLQAALDWVAANTPRDHSTRYLEAKVTAWHNADPPRVEIMRSRVREVSG